MAKKCPCNSEKTYSWHFKNKIPACAYSLERRNKKRAELVSKNKTDAYYETYWDNGALVGSSISLPEFEEL